LAFDKSVHHAKNDFVADLKPLFDLSPDPLCLLASNGYFKMVNEALKKTLGYTEEELAAVHFLHYIHPEDKDYTIKQIDSLSVTETPCFFENRFQYAGGQYKWLLWNVKKLPDETFYASAKDITRYKKLQEFTESKENYKLLFYSNPLPIVIYDMETLTILDANQVACTMYGYSREEFLKLTIKDIRPPEDVPLMVEATKNWEFDAEIKNLGTWNHLKKDGTLFKVEITGHSIDYMDRHCMFVVCNDVTELSKTLHSLELSIERFEYVTEATSDVVWDWDLETNEVYYSSNIKKLFGHTPKATIGDVRFFARHVHPEDRERVVLYPNLVKYGTMKYWTENYRFQKANGEYAFVLDKGIIIRDKNGVGIRMIGAMQDITELKNNELHITKQKDQLMEIAQINAHEIRRPIATILGLISLINRNTMTDKGNLEILEHLETATHELDMVIKRIIYKTID
jgi:PAS domain S-box-containing protein